MEQSPVMYITFYYAASRPHALIVCLQLTHHAFRFWLLIALSDDTLSTIVTVCHAL